MGVSKEHQVADPVRTDAPLPEDAAQLRDELALNPGDAMLWMQYGLALSRACLMREAVEAYSRAIALEPFCGILYRHRGHRHVSCWEYTEAAADFEMAARLIPDNWDVWYHLGLSYYLMGEYKLAAGAYKRCLEITDMEDIEAYPAIIDWSWRTANRLGDTAYAEELIAMLPAEFPVDTDECGYALNCSVYQGRTSVDKVLEICREGDELHGITNLYAMGNYLYVTGERERAREVMEQGIAYADAEGWCAFGYLAAMEDLKRLEF